MVARLRSFFCALALVSCGSSSEHHDVVPDETPPPRVASTRGSAVVLTRDERIAVVTNRSAGVVTVFGLDPTQPLDQLVRTTTEIDVDAASFHNPSGPGSEPWAAVIGADDDTAYVVSRYDQSVFRITHLHAKPTLDAEHIVAVGSEPTGIAITPSGDRIFVANWGEGTISVLYHFENRGKIDLNAPLAAMGNLGQVTDSVAPYTTARPALAHPRALAITDNGDSEDGDETLYATEFFSQPGPEDDPKDLTRFDRNRQGLVYSVRLTKSASVGTPIVIQPVPSTGFVDSKGSDTACFPNQLYAAAVDQARLFVTSMCTSPVGPLGAFTPPDAAPGTPPNLANFKTLYHPSVFVVDTRSNSELPSGGVLTKPLEDLYAEDSNTSGRMPLIPNDIAFLPSTGGRSRRACLTAMGADAVFCAEYDLEGRLLGVGESGSRYIDLHADPFKFGLRPIGLAVSATSAAPFALVANDGSQTLSVIDLTTDTVNAVTPTAPTVDHANATRTSSANKGHNFFATGLDLWSLKGQAWGSCESCHPDGLSDGVTWFFSRGPRRTISAAGTYDPTGQRRVMLWTGNIDEVHDIDGIVRTVTGGTGAILQDYSNTPSNALRLIYDGKTPATGQKATTTLRNNLNGSVAELLQSTRCAPSDEQCDRTPITDWNDIDAFVRSVRSPRRPTEIYEEQQVFGQAQFEKGLCTGCHSGPSFTLSRVFYTPGADANGTLPTTKPDAIDPAMLGWLRRVEYVIPPKMDLLAVNPPAANGPATLRPWSPGTQDPVAYAYADGTAGSDQINCVLRAVGTFPVQDPGSGSANTTGIVPKGAPSVPELRQDMTTLALGATGFNIPSLVGAADGAPYFHAGNARTLEEVFDDVFTKHHLAFRGVNKGDFAITPEVVRGLVAFLLSLDDAVPPGGVPPRLTPDLPFSTDLCPSGPPP